MNGMILYPTHDDIKILNEAMLKVECLTNYSRSLNCSKKDYNNLENAIPSIILGGVLSGIVESIIYPKLKINETVLG